MSDQSNSTELTVLGHAPQMLARAFDQARSPLGDNRDRLRHKFAFVDTLLRYLFAVLAAENAGLGRPAPDKCKSLINRLVNPAWGDWSKAVEALARSVLASPGQPVAPEFATLIVAPNDIGSLEPTDFHAALITLIDLRNKVAHEDGSVFCTEAQAGQHLLSGEVITSYLRLVGEKPEKVNRRTEVPPALKPRYRFQLDEEGPALYLSPFVMVEGALGNGVPAPRLIDGWDEATGQPSYDSPNGNRRQALLSPPADMPKAAGDLLELPAPPPCGGRDSKSSSGLPPERLTRHSRCSTRRVALRGLWWIRIRG